MSENNRFIPFETAVDAIALPEKFTFPFYYDPHPIALVAAKELQAYLEHQTEWEHNFGLEKDQEGLIIGKMFGVLVVQKENGALGYLAAFSGKLAGGNHHTRFVPPVYDMLTEDGFFNAGVPKLNDLTERIEALENSAALLAAERDLKETTLAVSEGIEAIREENRLAKAARKIKRITAQETMTADQFEVYNSTLIKESLAAKHRLRDAMETGESLLNAKKAVLKEITDTIEVLKRERKQTSFDLQNQIFEEYQFLNRANESRSLLSIFKNTAVQKPPAGAGECAAPKLLQYAFLHGLKPIALAEFWWGASPKSEIRKHGNFYPACRGKCEPILTHMLKGLHMDENPMLSFTEPQRDIEILYEDDLIIVINKPAEFLSVPGKTISDCVYTRMKAQFPTAEDPLIVHRLDMATSGIMVLTKTRAANKQLQAQFIKRTISKKYIAMLDGLVEEDEGIIDLPLRTDIDDRPRQLVCYEHGKPAQTKWKVLERIDGKTRIEFTPITGRTHQLRMHAAHPSGLNIAIVGDDLYGTKAHRLHLHAQQLEFKHPGSKRDMVFMVDADF